MTLVPGDFEIGVHDPPGIAQSKGWKYVGAQWIRGTYTDTGVLRYLKWVTLVELSRPDRALKIHLEFFTASF